MLSGLTVVRHHLKGAVVYNQIQTSLIRRRKNKKNWHCLWCIIAPVEEKGRSFLIGAERKQSRIAHPRFISTLNSYWKHLIGHCDDYVGFDFWIPSRIDYSSVALIKFRLGRCRLSSTSIFNKKFLQSHLVIVSI